MSRKLLNEELNRLTTEEYKDAEKLPIVVVLDNVRSLNNIGSVFRTSDAFRLSKIYSLWYHGNTTPSGNTQNGPRSRRKRGLGVFRRNHRCGSGIEKRRVHDSIRGTSGKQYFSGTIRHRKRTKICFHLRKRGKRRATGSS